MVHTQRALRHQLIVTWTSAIQVDVVYKQLSCLDLGAQAIYTVDNSPPPPQGGDKFQEIASNSLSKLVHSFSYDILTYSTIVITCKYNVCGVSVFTIRPPTTHLYMLLGPHAGRTRPISQKVKKTILIKAFNYRKENLYKTCPNF